MNWMCVRNPLTCSDLLNLETELDITLPDDYKARIGTINGGALPNAYILMPQLGEVPYSRNIALHKGARAGIFDLVHILNSGKITLFPFAGVGNGDYFCFDLINNTVVLYLHEIQETRYVCDTFTQLMDKLIFE